MAKLYYGNGDCNVEGSNIRGVEIGIEVQSRLRIKLLMLLLLDIRIMEF